MSEIKLKRGHVREDGMVFMCYSKRKRVNGDVVVDEVWMTREKFEVERAKRIDAAKASAARALAADPEGVLAKRKAYYRENKAEQNERSRRWQRANRHKCLKWIADWRKRAIVKDPAIKAAHNARCRLWMALKGSAQKATNTFALIGFPSRAEYKTFLESLWLPGMTWENYGKWHVDHIIPCRHFRPWSDEAQRVCFHHSNLQPLWHEDNVRKHGLVSDESFDRVCTQAPSDHVPYLRALQERLRAAGKIKPHAVLLEKLSPAAGERST